ncbi:unnamed protein product [Clonostachys rosea f. rosea IK726]|uniref:Uncharacterized protein n=2 Tax=Bionectria ochroleuca TaxID=29856 RepID=A0A0B7JPZ1_BIOOC|nr:unnamed protein product [Clonostachys rosea f. rosea IK726]
MVECLQLGTRTALATRRALSSNAAASYVTRHLGNSVLCHGEARRARSRGVRAYTSTSSEKKERVVILGSGWAGYALARSVSPSKKDRVLISPRSYFVFTPLLASASVGTIEFRAAIEPVRRLGLTDYHQAWASEAGPIPSGKEFEVGYDKLVIAVGCHSQTFGVEGVKEHACFLRDVGDSRLIRLKVLKAFEGAALPSTSEEDKKKLLHFAVVGGGPTGIEFAAELFDLVHEDLSKMYPALMKYVNITIYDIAPKVLPMFDKNLANYAIEMFHRQGIKVKTEHHLQRIRRVDDHLMLKIKEEPEEVGAGVVVWSTGLKQNPLVEKLVGQEIEGFGKILKDPKTGGIIVDEHMRVQTEFGSNGNKEKLTLPDVFAIGDCSVVEGEGFPNTAQVASQQAVYLGRQLNKGIDENKPFRFRNWGTMAYLGSWRAIHQSASDELKGKAAWILWRTAYLTKSMSIRNKLLIPVYWAITWIFGRDISRF